jgi:catechol 2,3-dioxygenase-like lactoylglutathione lyase family enzyme
MMATTATGLSRIMQVAMSVRDITRAVPFYRDTLGMRLLFEAPPGLAFFDCDGIRLMLSPVELSPKFTPPGSIP